MNNGHIEAEPFSDPMLHALMTMETETPELRARCQQLADERNKLNVRTAKFLSEQANALQERLEREHEEVLARGERQEALLQELQSTIHKLMAEANKLAEEESWYANQFEIAKEELRQLGRWTSVDTVKRARTKVENARKALQLATEAKSAPQQRANYIALVDVPRETELLQKIVVEETRLRARIQGREICDPEFGLIADARTLAELRP